MADAIDSGSNLQIIAFLLLKMLENSVKRKKLQTVLAYFAATRRKLYVHSLFFWACIIEWQWCVNIAETRNNMSPLSSLAHQAAIFLLQNTILRMLSSNNSMKNTLK